jgi:hypothetical protein
MKTLRPSVPRSLSWPAAALALAVVSPPASRAGVLFDDPAGGWDYLFDGETDLRTNPSGVAPFIALDGTWRRDESNDWDSIQSSGGLGTKPGDGYGPVPDDPPGGVVTLLEDTTDYLRIQDTGFPQDWNYEVNDNHNGKFWFGHSVEREHPGVTSIMSTEGITITFRARIPSDGPLDPIHPQTTPDLDPEFPDLDAITPWFPKGYNVTDDGQGMFNVEEDGSQDVPGVPDGGFAVGFALALDIDTPEATGDPYFLPNIPGGLVMNNRPGFLLPGSDRANLVPDIANIVPMSDEDLLDWHEWWITIEGAGIVSGARAYNVDVYRDGMSVPNTFLVRTSNNGQYTGQHIAFGLSGNSFFGAMDMDFFGYKLGVHTPVPEPGAGTAALAAFGALAGAQRLRRRAPRSCT